jgi:hypothetical protein
MDGIPRRFLGVVLGVALVSVACAAAGSPTPAVTGSPTPAATKAPPMTPAASPPAPTEMPATPPATAAIPETPPAPTVVPTARTSLPPFACARAVSQPGSVPIALMSGMTAVNDGASGRITFTFRPAGNVAAVPTVTVRPAKPPFTRDPSGLPLTVAGIQFLEIVLQGGTALDANLDATFDGPFDFALHGSPIVEVKRAGDFEAVSTFVVGLDAPACARILPPDGTGTLVIEIQSP